MVYMVVIIFYLFGLLGVAVYQARKVKTSADFSVAGRSLSPWILVLTMLATWVGTGSILGNAGKAYSIGVGGIILPIGGVLGMILLVFIAPRVRNYEKFSVPEIIESRYGHLARVLVVLSLVTAYLVIVSYQFNAGGGVLQYVVGKKTPVVLNVSDEITSYQAGKGYVYFQVEDGVSGEIRIPFAGKTHGVWEAGALEYVVQVVRAGEVLKTNIDIHDKGLENTVAAAAGQRTKINFAGARSCDAYRLEDIVENIVFDVQEYKLSIRTATAIAACFIIAFTMIAGLISIAYIDIGNGILIIGSLLVTFPYLWIKAGGMEGMTAAFAGMGRKENMDFFSHLNIFKVINYCLPAFLLILGDANLYQRFFASKNARGARRATFVLIFVALIIELLIIGCGWVAGSLIPDAEEGKYVLIVAAKYIMPTWLGCIFMTNIVAIIISTADSFLLVPSTSLVRDIYMAYINPEASEKHIVFLSRLFVFCLGIAAFIVSLSFERVPGFLSRALYAYTIYGTAVTPALVAALFWKGATKQGAVASILSGTFMTLFWKKMTFMSSICGMKFDEIDEVLPAITVSVAALVIVSFLTMNKQKVQVQS